MLFLDNICPIRKLLKGFYKLVPKIQPSLLDSTNSNFGEYPQDFLCFFKFTIFQVNINLYLYLQGYNPSKGTYEKLKCFIKSFTKLEICLNVQNNYQKILQKFSFHESRSIEMNQVSIESSFRSIEQESSTNRNRQRLQYNFLHHFD